MKVKKVRRHLINEIAKTYSWLSQTTEETELCNLVSVLLPLLEMGLEGKIWKGLQEVLRDNHAARLTTAYTLLETTQGKLKRLGMYKQAHALEVLLAGICSEAQQTSGRVIRGPIQGSEGTGR